MRDCITFQYNSEDPKTLENLYKAILAWINCKELKNLIQSFGATIPNLEFEARIKWLVDFSQVWDYRSKQQTHDGKVRENLRWLVSSNELTENQKEFIRLAIHRLGLIGGKAPCSDAYDYMLVLGGARLSCLLRTRWASQVFPQIKTRKAIVLLSAYRPIADSEKAATDTYAPGAAYEFDLMNRSAEMNFKLQPEYQEKTFSDENQNNCWAVRQYKMLHENFPVYSLAAPSGDPAHRRANSADTFRFFFDHFDVKPKSSLLLVTSQIYVPYQQLEAVRTLAVLKNLSIETIGYPTEWSSELQGMNQPVNYLQEIRSAIQSIDRLVREYPRNRSAKNS